jgi:hypothetical protein
LINIYVNCVAAQDLTKKEISIVADVADKAPFGRILETGRRRNHFGAIAARRGVVYGRKL